MSLKGNVDVLSVHIQGCGDGSCAHTHTQPVPEPLTLQGQYY